MVYPEPDDPNFNTKLTKRYEKFTIPKTHNTLEKICFPKEYKVQIQQLFLADFINPKTPYKGVLVYHRIGAGKTCAAIRISENFVKRKYQVIIVLPASLRNNFKDELRSRCANDEYLTEHERTLLRENLPTNAIYQNIIKTSNDRIDKHYKIYSYNKFFDIINEIDLEKTLLIIDEVQNVVSEIGTYYEQLSAKLKNPPETLRTVIMTATPIFDKPLEIALTMNLILPEDKQFYTGKAFNDSYLLENINKDGSIDYTAINMDEFKTHIKGYVSYYRGAPEIAFPQAEFKIINCVMSPFQFNAYNKVRKVEKQFQEPDEASNSFFIGSRTYSNFVFPNAKAGQAGLKSLRESDFNMDNLQQRSIKLWKLYKKIKNLNGLHFVYSSFKGYAGLTVIARMLEYQGYKNYHVHGPGPKRYAFWTGDQSDKDKDEIKSVFNHPLNENGSKIRVILGSPSIKEGVSLLRLHVIHIFEPYWNMSRLEQVMGRGIRYCSHKDMPEDRRLVLIFLYLATYPTVDETVDQKIMKMAVSKTDIRSQFEMALKEAAVDCRLFKRGNKTTGERINCDE